MFTYERIDARRTNGGEGQMCSLQQKLNVGRLMMGQPPEGVSATRGQKGASNEEPAILILGHDFDAEIVASLEQEIHLERFNPPPSRAVGGDLVEVRTFQDQAFGVVPQAEPLGHFSGDERFLNFCLVHTDDNKKNRKS
jgi:hypothetical protein